MPTAISASAAPAPSSCPFRMPPAEENASHVYRCRHMRPLLAQSRQMPSGVYTVKHATSFWETRKNYARFFISKAHVQSGVSQPQTQWVRGMANNALPVAWCQHTRRQRDCSHGVLAPCKPLLYRAADSPLAHHAADKVKGNTDVRAQHQARTKSKDSPNHWRSCRAAGVSSSAYSWTNVPTSVTSSASFTFKS